MGFQISGFIITSGMVNFNTIISKCDLKIHKIFGGHFFG